MKEHVGGSTFLAAIVLKEVDCCFLNQTASAFWVFLKATVLIQVHKGSALQAESQSYDV